MNPDQFVTTVTQNNECDKCETSSIMHGPFYTHNIGDRRLTMCESCNKDFDVWLERNHFDSFMDIVGRAGNYRE